MRLHRFYIDQDITGDSIRIENADLIHQWKNVFRYITGGQVVVFNGDGFDYFCMISEISRNSAVLAIMQKKASVMPEKYGGKKIGVAMSCIKKDLMELVIQKATELGVAEIFPIISERSEKKSLNMERARKIAIEASEQSGRGDVPTVAEPVELADFLLSEDVQKFQRKVVFHPHETEFAEKSSPNQRLKFESIENTGDSSVLLFIGPEGGFSDAEMDVFTEKGFEKYALGDLILRAETAAIVAMTLVTFLG